MNKRKQGRSLSRPKDQRDALKNSLLVSLVRYQSIKTTLAKARELRPFAEKMLTHAKVAVLDQSKSIAKTRLLHTFVSEETVKGLMKLAEKMKSRQGGYTRILKLPNRKSDASPMAMIEWVEKIELPKATKESKIKVKKKGDKVSKDQAKVSEGDMSQKEEANPTESKAE